MDEVFWWCRVRKDEVFWWCRVRRDEVFWWCRVRKYVGGNVLYTLRGQKWAETVKSYTKFSQ